MQMKQIFQLIIQDSQRSMFDVLQVSFGKAACGGGGPSIICGQDGQNVEIIYG